MIGCSAWLEAWAPWAGGFDAVCAHVQAAGSSSFSRDAGGSGVMRRWSRQACVRAGTGLSQDGGVTRCMSSARQLWCSLDVPRDKPVSSAGHLHGMSASYRLVMSGWRSTGHGPTLRALKAEGRVRKCSNHFLMQGLPSNRPCFDGRVALRAVCR